MDLQSQLNKQKHDWLHKDIQWLEKRFHDIQYAYTPCNTNSTARRFVKDINTAKRQMIKTQGCQAKTIVAFHTPAYQVELIGTPHQIMPRSLKRSTQKRVRCPIYLMISNNGRSNSPIGMVY